MFRGKKTVRVLRLIIMSLCLSGLYSSRRKFLTAIIELEPLFFPNSPNFCRGSFVAFFCRSKNVGSLRTGENNWILLGVVTGANAAW